MSPAIALLGQFPNLTVRVAPGVYTGSSNWGFKLTNGSSLTIAGIPSTVDDAENLALPVFDLAGASFFLWNLEVDNFTAAFSDLEFTNGNPGVLDFLSTDFTGENLVFSNTSGTPPLSVEDGSVELANCSFVDSQQPLGAGFFAAKRVSSVSLKGCLFEGGFAPQGGALSFVRFGAVSIDSCTFRGNQARYAPQHIPVAYGPSAGAGAFLTGTSLSITRTLFQGNSAFQTNNTAVYSAEGGAIRTQSVTTVTISDCVFNSNWAFCAGSNAKASTASGGAIAMLQSHTTIISSSLFVNNSAAATSFDGSMLATSSSFAGAVASVGASRITITGTSFIGNSVRAGGGENVTALGGAYYSDSATGPTVFQNCSFVSNGAFAGDPSVLSTSAIISGAAVYCLQAFPGSLQIRYSLFQDTRGYSVGTRASSIYGGVIFAPIDGTTTSIQHTIFLENNQLTVNRTLPVMGIHDLVEGYLVWASSLNLVQSTVANHSIAFSFSSFSPYRGSITALQDLIVSHCSFSNFSLTAPVILGGLLSLPAGADSAGITANTFDLISFHAASNFRGGVLDASDSDISIVQTQFSNIVVALTDPDFVFPEDPLIQAAIVNQDGGSFSINSVLIDSLSVRVELTAGNFSHMQILSGAITSIHGANAIQNLSITNSSIDIIDVPSSGNTVGLILILNFSSAVISSLTVSGHSAQLNALRDTYYFSTVSLWGSGGSASVQNAIFRDIRISGKCSCLGVGMYAGSSLRNSQTIETLSVTDSVFERNVAACLPIASHAVIAEGGALQSTTKSSLLIENCHFRSNWIAGRNQTLFSSGAAVFAQFPTPDPWSLVVKDSSFTDNVAANGGAIYLVPQGTGNLSLINSTFKHNLAKFDVGGSISAIGPTASVFTGIQSYLLVDRCVFSENNALRSGGAISSTGLNMNISSSVFTANTNGHDPRSFFDNPGPGDENGGALYSLFGTVDIIDSVFNDNISPSKGGAVYFATPKFSIQNSTFSRNLGSVGGVLYLQPILCAPLSSLVTNSWFEENLSLLGGSIFASTGDTIANPAVRFISSHFVRNIGIGLSGLVTVQPVTPWQFAYCQNSTDADGDITFLQIQAPSNNITSPLSVYVQRALYFISFPNI